MTSPSGSHDHLMTPAEVAAIFRVGRTTVARWANAGRLPFIRTPGGQRRFRQSDVNALARGESR